MVGWEALVFAIALKIFDLTTFSNGFIGKTDISPC